VFPLSDGADTFLLPRTSVTRDAVARVAGRGVQNFGDDAYHVKVDTSLPEKQNRWGKKSEFNGGGDE
jgi:hypothetical protein